LFNVTIEVLLGRIIGLVIGFTLHEAAHAYTAYRLGDSTAYYQGRVTLDPRAHIEPFGILLALVAGFGWARPVPVNASRLEPDPERGLVIVSLAGPLMNLLIALGVGVLIRALVIGGVFETAAGRLVGGGIVTYGTGGRAATFVYEVLGTVVLFNLVLFLFNLLPAAPLDGFKIAAGVLPWRYASWLVRHERETTFALLLLLFLGPLTQGRINPLWSVLGPPLRALYEVFTGLYPVFT